MKHSILSPRAGAIRALAKIILLGLALVAIGRWLATPARGAVVPLTWVGGSFWSNPNNWDPRVVPQNGENVVLPASPLATDPDDMVNDLTDLTIRSMFFDLHGNTLKTFDWNLKGNTLGIIDNITLSAVVSWSSPSTGFVLQQNTDLNTANWVTAPQSVSDNGTNKLIIVNPRAGNPFYRLFKPSTQNHSPWATRLRKLALHQRPSWSPWFGTESGRQFR